MRLTMILLALLPLISGCLPTCPQMPLRPAKPTLAVTQTADGGITLGREDTRKLLLYITDLENGYSK